MLRSMVSLFSAHLSYFIFVAIIGNSFLFTYSLGGAQLVEELLQNEALAQNKFASAGLQSMKLFLNYCEQFDVLDKVIIHCES